MDTCICMTQSLHYPPETITVLLIGYCCCSCLIAKSCSTLCDLMKCSMPGFSVLYYLPKIVQTHAHCVNDAIQPVHPPLSPSPLAPQSFPASGSFPMSQLWASGGQSNGVSASASVLPMNIQNWFPLGLTGLISLLSKLFSRVFSSTTVQKCQFFMV